MTRKEWGMKLYAYATYPYESVIFAFAPDKEIAYRLIVDKYMERYGDTSRGPEEVDRNEITEYTIPTEPIAFIEAH